MSFLVLALIAVAVFMALALLVETNMFGWATTVMVVSVLCVQFLGVFDVLTYVKSNLYTLGLYSLGYLALGVVWSFVKWFSYLMNFRDQYREARAKLDRNLAKALPEDSRRLRETFGYQWRKPTAADNKGRIVAWMSFWPFSFVGTLINDPIRRLFSYLFNSFKALYQKMADRIFKDDFELDGKA